MKQPDITQRRQVACVLLIKQQPCWVFAAAPGLMGIKLNTDFGELSWA